MDVAIPSAFLARMAALLGEEYPAFLASYDAPPSVGLRVNTLKIAVGAFRQLAPFDLTPVPWCPAGFEIIPVAIQSEITSPQSGIEALAGHSAGGKRLAEPSIPGYPAPGKHPYHAAGLYYLQDPSAMAVAELLAPQPGERVLDLAAAPGGKTTHIASLMQGQGLLLANEVHPQRAWELAGNLERWGARNVAITVETPERLAERFPGFFDAVLVDAPCSGEGMMRKGEAARREWSPELVRGCALRQTAILEHAARLVRPGGRLAYSTCTFNPDENEGTIARFLADHPDFALLELPQRPGFSPGRPDWIVAPVAGRDVACNVSTGNVSTSNLTRAVRLWPHLAPGEGHFIAVLRRVADATAPGPANPWRLAKLPKPVEDAYHAFCATVLKTTDPRGHTKAHQTVQKGFRDPSCPSWTNSSCALVGSYLYALPAGLPDLTGLRYLHPGWWLGTVKKDRFEPSHALALGLRAQDAQRVLDLRPDDPALAAYLRGETLASPGEDGWTLGAVDGYPCLLYTS
ncbi:MAG: RsmF rRNA methyltransferase first C-terminal domain-containing protein, partial [Anaerolineae bacterium]|nr:RsmF rRNA methyltransferase first C-terminal domain-containing protein [Anaerolineae bacterium]